MPVTKTAKRALRSAGKKASHNRGVISALEIAIRLAKAKKKEADIRKAISLTDRAAKKHAIHKNKAARIKSVLSKLLPKTKSPRKMSKKTTKKLLKKKIRQ